MTIAQDPAMLLARAHDALANGDVIVAYDLATELGEPDDRDLAYVEVRALAGMGDWRNALRRYRKADIGARGDVDSLALHGRILKDAALAAPPAERRKLFEQSSQAYAAAWQSEADFYAAINAAATAAMAGDGAATRAHANRALAGAENAPKQDYWSWATRAEALLLLDRADEAEMALMRAAEQDGATIAARASTYRQFIALAEVRANSIDLAAIRPPRTAHFCGHMFNEDGASEARIAAATAGAMDAEQIGWAFGALACGADIVIAETCLALGVELHIIVPFDEEDFIAASVRPGGEGWVARYQACRNAAARVYQASAMRYVQDDNQFVFGSEVAMGLARLRAEQLGSEAVQLAVWDGIPPHGPAGSAADVARWTETGARTIRLDCPDLPRNFRQSAIEPASLPDVVRRLRVLAFTDFSGFSGLREDRLPLFWREVMGRSAASLQSADDHLSCRNTWGDALYLAFDDVAAAAAALTDLRDAVAAMDFARLGLPSGGGMRIAAHYGAVYEVLDPVTQAPNFYGSEVSRAARVEPVTPPEQVWITEPLAAAIRMACPDRFDCHYVGRIALAKNYGSERIYRLERAMHRAAKR